MGNADLLYFQWITGAIERSVATLDREGPMACLRPTRVWCIGERHEGHPRPHVATVLNALGGAVRCDVTTFDLFDTGHDINDLAAFPADGCCAVTAFRVSPFIRDVPGWLRAFPTMVARPDGLCWIDWIDMDVAPVAATFVESTKLQGRPYHLTAWRPHAEGS